MKITFKNITHKSWPKGEERIEVFLDGEKMGWLDRAPYVVGFYASYYLKRDLSKLIGGDYLPDGETLQNYKRKLRALVKDIRPAKRLSIGNSLGYKRELAYIQHIVAKSLVDLLSEDLEEIIFNLKQVKNVASKTIEDLEKEINNGK